METLLGLLPLSLLLMSGAAAVFIWAVNRKQFERLDEHGLDIFANPDPSGDDHEHTD